MYKRQLHQSSIRLPNDQTTMWNNKKSLSAVTTSDLYWWSDCAVAES